MVLPSFWFQIIRYICNFNDKVIAIITYKYSIK